MSKYEGRIFLERLVELRKTYANSQHDATPMTTTQAIEYAIDLLENPDRLDALLAESPADGASPLHAV